MIIEAAGPAIVEDNKLLLVWKIKVKHYIFPGGRINEGESPEQTCRREVKEELGVEIEVIKYLGGTEHSHKKGIFRSHLFLAKISKGEPEIKEPEVHDHFIWMPISKYKDYELPENVIEFCEDYLSGEY